MQDAASSPMFVPMRMRSRGPVARVPARLALPSEVEQPPTPVEVLPPKPTPTACDPELIAILDAPLHAGETAAAGFARKERELGAAFAKLTILAAYALRKRLANPLRDDVLAEKFARLTVERRNRLLQFLADVRRRAALAQTGR